MESCRWTYCTRTAYKNIEEKKNIRWFDGEYSDCPKSETTMSTETNTMRKRKTMRKREIQRKQATDDHLLERQK